MRVIIEVIFKGDVYDFVSFSCPVVFTFYKSSSNLKLCSPCLHFTKRLALMKLVPSRIVDAETTLRQGNKMPVCLPPILPSVNLLGSDIK
ncbi:unnamed protein product [Hymenolepis diminuta]|uniref:Ovule protein n=1 Tax=Hymenolepis diminuta TaxID=6216 RepID=A0A0R3SZE0_HYMDI|nr:unnamed protein product [Hymenolepis diminuta]